MGFRLTSTPRSKVAYAMRNGLLKPAEEVECERCGEPSEHKHHEDYGKPLEVIYLCRECHIQRHKELGWGVGGYKADYNLEKIPVGASVTIPNVTIKKIATMAWRFSKRGFKFKCFTFNDSVVVFRLK